LIRGKGSQKEGSAPQPDDEDEQHVLIIGDSAENVRRAQNTIERVITADDSTRNKIRQEQLTVAAQLNNAQQPAVNTMDDSMMTPYGPPSPYAYIIPVPNDCVGLVIGKGGETIRNLQQESGAKI
jgi:far upstream element-binding protein